VARSIAESGAPAAPGDYGLTLRVADRLGRHATWQFTLVIEQRQPEPGEARGRADRGAGHGGRNIRGAREVVSHRVV
jgi:hypothetical protein